MEIRTSANGRKYEYHEESAQRKIEIDRLRAEVASLKEERDSWRAAFCHKQKQLDHKTVKYTYLTQQLSTAQEYAERLAEAGQAVVDRWDSPDWADGTHTIDYINRLRAAIRKSEG